MGAGQVAPVNRWRARRGCAALRHAGSNPEPRKNLRQPTQPL